MSIFGIILAGVAVALLAAGMLPGPAGMVLCLLGLAAAVLPVLLTAGSR